MRLFRQEQLQQLQQAEPVALPLRLFAPVPAPATPPGAVQQADAAKGEGTAVASSLKPRKAPRTKAGYRKRPITCWHCRQATYWGRKWRGTKFCKTNKKPPEEKVEGVIDIPDEEAAGQAAGAQKEVAPEGMAEKEDDKTKGDEAETKDTEKDEDPNGGAEEKADDKTKGGEAETKDAEKDEDPNGRGEGGRGGEEGGARGVSSTARAVQLNWPPFWARLVASSVGQHRQAFTAPCHRDSISCALWEHWCD